MKNIIYLDGLWGLRLDPAKEGIEKKFYNDDFDDSIMLPATLSVAGKGEKNTARETGFLTEEYKFEGCAWFQRKVILNDISSKNIRLFLERTRKTMLWINGTPAGGLLDSLSTPHVYDVGEYLKDGENIITVMVDNTDYPTVGGHLTSPDTQTNWNGITGEISLHTYENCYAENIQVFPDIHSKTVRVRLHLCGCDKAEINAVAFIGNDCCPQQQLEISADMDGIAEFTYSMGEDIHLWSEYTPNIYTMTIEFANGDIEHTKFGMREFTADGMKFRINGEPVFLRGKHDGLVFPITGAAPTDVESWVKVLKTAKDYGINHYRFHTCCPPDAAFTAADMVGIYMEPELPFWGTLPAENEDGFNAAEQEYLINEGYKMMDAFGNHPSFCMFSLGNELWGNPQRMNRIMKDYKAYDRRHLYTMGSNNFQFYPTIVENDDFFCGVRLSGERLIRGSYAMCDAPLGHIQTDKPSTSHSYDMIICPPVSVDGSAAEGEIEIQYGTGVKKVKVTGGSGGLDPKIPVVSHEVGQYTFYPDFDETSKYTGVLKAENFEIFRERLAEKGMLDRWKKFYKAAGHFAAECYKNEIETAMRSEKLAGFQLLDLQDFPGQGTALVGILNAFMENKGFVTAEKWRGFCSDKVLLAQFDDYVISGSEFTAYISARCYIPGGFPDDYIRWEISQDSRVLAGGEFETRKQTGLINLGVINWKVPEYTAPEKITLTLTAKNTENSYDLWVFPETDIPECIDGVVMTENPAEALEELKNGGNVLLITDRLKNSIDGVYCTDFWCYPMFRSISESMNKPVPTGTMGLLIDKHHESLSLFPSERYSTPQWYNIVTSGVCAVLDDTPKGYYPIVQTIDNWERNHKLGNVFEADVAEGKLMVCTMSLEKLMQSSEGRWFVKSVRNYCGSENFRPSFRLDEDYIMSIFV